MSRYHFGKARAHNCSCTTRFTCGACMDKAGPTPEVRPTPEALPEPLVGHRFRGWEVRYDGRPGRTGFRADRHGVTISARKLSTLVGMLEIRAREENKA